MVLVEAKCDCGYLTQHMLGSFVSPREKIEIKDCYFPVLCRQCQSISVADLYQKPLSCQVCKNNQVVPYYSEELKESAAERKLREQQEQQEALSITDGVGEEPILLTKNMLRQAMEKQMRRSQPDNSEQIVTGFTIQQQDRSESVYLTASNYYCPKCQEYRVKFVVLMIKD